MQYVQKSTSDIERVKYMEKLLGITEAREKFGSVVEQVQFQGNTYIIQRHGKPAAAIVPIEVYESWKKERKAFFDLIRQSQAQANLAAEEAEKFAAEVTTSIRAQD